MIPALNNICFTGPLKRKRKWSPPLRLLFPLARVGRLRTCKDTNVPHFPHLVRPLPTDNAWPQPGHLINVLMVFSFFLALLRRATGSATTQKP